MKKIYLIMAVATTVAFTACSSDDLASIDPTTPSTSADENVPINFGTYIGNAKSTRAAKNDINSIDELIDAGGFGVFAINTETNKFAPDNADNHTLSGDYNYMFNQEVTGTNTNGTTTWETTPVKYWPNKTLDKNADGKLLPQYVSFFAYAPYCKIADQTQGNEENFNWWESYELYHGGSADFKGGIIAMSTSQYFEQDIDPLDQKKWFSKADPIIAIDLTNASSQTDFLWGTAGKNNGDSEDGDKQGGTSLKNNAGKEADGALGGEYPVNANLTKMKTDGKVSFAFKHALASLGGHKANEAANQSTITIDAVADAVKPSDTKQLANDTRISLKWLAIEVMGTKDGKDAVPYPTKGFFNLATGLWGQMAKDPTGSTELNQDVTYYASDNPVYVMYPNGTNFNYANVTPYLNNTKSDNFKKIPFNSVLAVNGDGGDSYEDFITTTDEDDTQNPVIEATSTWYTKPTQEESGSEEEGTTKKVPNAGVTTTATSVFVSDKAADPLLIIPNSTIKPKIRVIANYDIVTPDPAYNNADGHKGYTKANQVVGKDITFTNAAELNKKYKLQIHLGVTSMKVDATVVDWEVDKTGTGESVVEETKDIDLPNNVAGDENSSSNAGD